MHYLALLMARNHLSNRQHISLSTFNDESAQSTADSEPVDVASENEMARPVHFWAAQQLFIMGAAPQVTSIMESALIAAALRLSVSIARLTSPVTRPPIGDPEQSAALIS